MFTPKNIQGALEELYDLCDPDYMVDMLVNYSEEFDDISPTLLARSFQKNAEMVCEYRVLSSAGEGIDYQGTVLLNSRAVRLLSYVEDTSGNEKVRTIQSKELWLTEDMTFYVVSCMSTITMDKEEAICLNEHRSVVTTVECEDDIFFDMGSLICELDDIESTHPGYDEYRYALDEIGHNPYELAAYLTVVFEDYTREEVQAELVRLFEEQYDLELDEEVEIRSYTTTDEDGNTSTVYYEYRILNVTLTNYGLGNVIASSRLTAEQWERYKVLLETLGNRSYLFGEDVSSAPGGGGEYTDYDIPGEALTDTAFANMVREAEKYLGYPYVWGGSSPSTSFDCSGFVSWVINNCGNGWSVGRQTANGLKNLCDIIPPSEAKPGDLIFFQGTYNTSGASHVGIYVGNGMMIHCGDPISYASIETNYWQQHFYCFGRIP